MPSIVCRLVEVCVFRFERDHSEYLLLKRSRADALYPGIWQVVTGTINKKERAVDAALRELREETGLSPRRFWSVPFSSTFYDYRDDAMAISPLFAAQVDAGDEPRLSAEHERFDWMPYGSARRHLVWPSQRVGLDIIEQYVIGGEEASLHTLIPIPC